jgi:hypothetical protein
MSTTIETESNDQSLPQTEIGQQSFLNETVLTSEGLCHHAGGHDNHAHFEIKSAV